MELTVHDLIRIQSAADLQSDGPIPQWVHEAISWSPWVVVRRTFFQTKLIPVGVRGITRSQRFAAYLPERCALEVVTPVQLAAQARWRELIPLREIQAFSCLDEIANYYNQGGINWGLTGSAGYELASGAITVHPDSDIDLVIYAPYQVAFETADSWNTFNIQLSVRVDVKLETSEGACSLTEYVHSRSLVLLRTITGPRLVECPWTPEM